MNIFLQVILGLAFLCLAIISFTQPGLFLIKKFFKDIDDGIVKITLASVLGIALFALTAYILAFLHLRFLMWIFPVFGIWNIFKYRKEFLNFRLNLLNKKLFILVFLIGIIGQVWVNAPSGFPYENGIYFWSSHGHDGVWHLALMEQMHKNNFPFQDPEYLGQKLQNYHFFVDLLMSEFSRMFHFSNLDIYFRFMPVIFSILLGLGSFILVREWSNSETAGIWSVFFTYFAGSFGYLLYIPTHKSLGGESIFWVSQTQSVLGNPPHAAAFIISEVFLFALLKYFKHRKINYFLFCAFLGGVVIDFKVYAGALILLGLLTVGIFELVVKRMYKIILLFFTTLSIALAIYLPNSANSQDFLIWQPWWYIRTMVVAPDRLNWLDLELRRQTYISEGNWKRVIQLEATAFLIFLFGNLGMRFLGFWTIFKQIKGNIFKNSFNLFFLVITTSAFFIPVFFLQKGVAWNSIQFNQYFLLFFGFLAAISTVEILKIFKSKSLKWLISFVIIVLTIPTQIGLLWQFYSNSALSKISYGEIAALNFLKDQKGNLVLTAPFNIYERDKYKNPPIPIYAWYDTGYVSAFSGKLSLISDKEQLTIMGYDVNKLFKEREKVFQTSNRDAVNDFLKKYSIDYVYLVWGQKFATDSATINMDLIYGNNDAKIYKVRK